MDAWLAHFVVRGTNLPPLEAISNILWQIWKGRNNFTFRGSKPNACNIVDLARFQQKSFEKWSVQRTQARTTGENDSPQIWVPPAVGTLKINVDGSLSEDSTEGAIACVVRDHTGALVDGFTRSVRAVFTAQLETLALLEALKYIQRMRLKAVSLETDHQNLVRSLNTTEVFNWEARALLAACKDLLANLQLVGLDFCSRTANSIADWAARKHRKKSLPPNWVSFPPPALWALLCIDAPVLGTVGTTPAMI
ncbi:hypothetical protein ACJRO7_021794 [Eucalyptus globulus]|uniref:RNase H type-1 domain-containing protein n=1 Tax=Eucalyptus globulus TaxID=34317 RepID=A0ABD3KQW8_EUCGL